jgi:hypothetical protein
MPDQDPRDAIELGGPDDASAEERGAVYRRRIHEARTQLDALKGSEPLRTPLKQRLPLLTREGVGAASQQVDPISATGGVQPRPPGSPVLRPETAKQLEDLAKAGKTALSEEEVQKQAEEEKDDLLDVLNFEKRNEAERILDNKKRRQEIEKRCEPMSLQDLIMRDEVRQRVPIVPGQFEVIYRSLTPEESLFIKQQMSKETVNTDSYLLEKYALCQLCCSLVSINGRDLPDHRDTSGSPTETLFKEKLKSIVRKSGYIVADLGVNYSWFDLRVRKLINPDDLKNG